MNDLTRYASEATLPEVYENARYALATCEKIDECKKWADKSAALRSYAKQAEDTTLMNHAMRIQARAVRRAGELLEAMEKAHGANQNITEGDHRKVPTRTEAAREAGMSEHQQKQATRVARVPEHEFEAQIESDTPPTVTALAEQGTAKHPGAPVSRGEGLRYAHEAIAALKRIPVNDGMREDAFNTVINWITANRRQP